LVLSIGSAEGRRPSMIDVLVLIFGAILINNFVLVRFLGICPFLGVSKQVDTALGMGFAVTFVMGIASGVTYLVQEKLLEPLHLEVLQTLTFILVIAVLVQFVEIVLKKVSPALYQALGIYLPLITTNCAVLGVTLINFNSHYNFILSVIHGIAAALGFTLVIVLFAGIRERLSTAPIPKALRGFPIALLTAGLMSIAFLGFSGLNLKAFFEYFAKFDWNGYQAYLVNLFI
jgi:electron transport complex protein RnfA